MRFEPKTAEEIASEGLIQPGEYMFEIIEAEEARSKAGNDMIKMRLSVLDDEGEHYTIWDYLMESVAYKLRHAAEACGLEKEYDRGELEALDFKGKTGRCKVSIQKDKTGQYPDKNGIADYLPETKSSAPRSSISAARSASRVPKTPAADLDDEIPF